MIMKKLALAVVLVLILTSVFSVLLADVHAQTQISTQESPVHVQTGVWIIDIQKIDLAASTYRLDFYLWFNFNPQQINGSEAWPGRVRMVDSPKNGLSATHYLNTHLVKYAGDCCGS